LLGNDCEAEDVIQATFVTGFECLGEVRDPGALRAWFRTIAIRKVNRVLAARYRRRSLSEEWSLTSATASDPRDGERIAALRRALSGLPPHYRVPWVMHHIEGETLPEVARRCGTSLTSVKRRIHEAKKRLDRTS
jgi:RNA polymerase sigma-70 factor (ECF subfamily)